MMHVPYRHGRREDPLALPTGSGITSVTTVSSVSVVDSTLAFDHSLSTTKNGLDMLPTSTPASTESSVSASTSTLATSSESGIPTTVAASSTKPIAISTVIGTCVGAFIVVSSIIIFSIWTYKRYSSALNKSARSRGHFHRRNKEQRQSHEGIWNKLEDNNVDKWEKSYHTQEAKDSTPADVTPMEKLTMFKKSPSVRTAYTHKSTDASNFSYPSSYAEFDPSLAASLKTSNSGPQPLLKHADSGLRSWPESNAAHVSSSVSVPRFMAIPTPPPTVSHPHKWEAAEIVHYSEGQSADVVNPFEEEESSGKMIHNPFFSAKDYAPSRKRSTSTSTVRSNSRTRSRANSTTTQATVTLSKGKERAVAPPVNPFDDITTSPEVPLPSFLTHGASSSTSSMDQGDRERALMSLVAALNLSEDEVRDRLRIASLQPSVMSGTSFISVSEDMTNEFPLPPSTPTTAFTTLSGR